MLGIPIRHCTPLTAGANGRRCGSSVAAQAAPGGKWRSASCARISPSIPAATSAGLSARNRMAVRQGPLDLVGRRCGLRAPAAQCGRLAQSGLPSESASVCAADRRGSAPVNSLSVSSNAWPEMRAHAPGRCPLRFPGRLALPSDRHSRSHAAWRKAACPRPGLARPASTRWMPAAAMPGTSRPARGRRPLWLDAEAPQCVEPLRAQAQAPSRGRPGSRG